MQSEEPSVAQPKNPNRSLIYAGLAAIGASLCCVAPVALLLLGIGGSWISTLTAMEPYRPIFVVAVVVVVGIVFRKLYLAPACCDEGQVCANPAVQRNQRILFWVVSALLLILLLFPYYGQIFLE
jgi:mercuric ion transport protein